MDTNSIIPRKAQVIASRYPDAFRTYLFTLAAFDALGLIPAYRRIIRFYGNPDIRKIMLAHPVSFLLQSLFQFLILTRRPGNSQVISFDVSSISLLFLIVNNNNRNNYYFYYKVFRKGMNGTIYGIMSKKIIIVLSLVSYPTDPLL